MQFPTVSVVIPTYNRAHLVGRAIQSVLAQTFPDWALLVIDDGSTDNTKEVVHSYRDERIHYLRHQTNRGANAARNTGIKAAQGEYLAFLDSDDEWLPEKLEAQLAVFRENPRKYHNLGVVLTSEWLVDRDSGEWLSTRTCTARGNVYAGFFLGTGRGIRLTTGLIKKTCLDDVGGFDESLPANQLWDLSVRIAEKYAFDTVERPLSIFYQHTGARLRNYDAVIKSYSILVDKYRDGIPHRRRFRSTLKKNIGVYYLKLGDAGKARRELWAAVTLRPTLEGIAYVAVSLMGGRPYAVLVGAKNRFLAPQSCFAKKLSS